MSRLNDIEKLRGWCHKVLPLVYDDSLSYYEVICKVKAKINEVIDLTAEQNDIIEEVVQEVADWETTTDNKYEEFTQRMTNLFNQFVSDMTEQENQFETSMNTRFDAFTSNTNNLLNKYKNDFVPDFNENHIYIVGEYCYYGDDNKFLYRCDGVPSGVLLPPQQFDVYTWERVDGAYPYGGVANNIVRDLDEWMSNKNGEITGRFNQLAQTYSNARTYEVGEVAWAYTSLDPMLQPSWHLYICTTAVETAEAFDPTKWENIVLAQYFEDQYAQFLADYQRQFGVAQDRGSSTTDVMSQKAVSDELEAHDESISKLLSDLAPEYDDEELYKIGNLLTYLGKQYYCIADAPAGTLPTNTTYFEEKSVADIIEMIKNGSIVTGHSEVADNLTPYSEDSGTTQENPFISQRTGTDNNSVIVTTGTIARQLEKQGNTVVKNQLLPNLNDFGTTDGATKSYSDGILTVTCAGQSQSGISSGGIKTPAGHIILKHIKFKGENGVEYGFNGQFSAITATGTWQDFYIVNTASATQYLVIQSNAATTFQITDAYYVDLTQWGFTADQITDLTSHPEHFSWYYNGSLAYDAGSLQNCNGRYLECGQGRNLFDQEMELGSIVDGTGEKTASSTSLRSKNEFLVIANTPIFYKGASAKIYFYDINHNYLGYQGWITNTYITVPAGAVWALFRLDTSYGTVYHNDISVELYYSPEQGGEGYGEMHDYIAPIRIDTGNETLKAFDKKLPSGVIERNTGEVNLGTANWTVYDTFAFIFLSPNRQSGASIKHIVSRIPSNISSIIFNTNNDGVVVNYPSGSYTTKEQLQTAFTGSYMQYELADAAKTTEQGTPFSEYAPINDYSYMAWFDTDGNLVSIPQGCKLFYPVDYKGFTDDLVMYTNGDATALAKNKDITDTALNARGYYKMQDLSSAITDVAGLTYAIKKATKCGNVVTLTIRAQNGTGSAIEANATLCQLGNELAPAYPIFAPVSYPNSTATIWSDGKIYVGAQIPANNYFIFTISYAL